MDKLTYRKPTYRNLAARLGVTESAIKKYPKLKRGLMLKGLFLEKLLKEQNLPKSPEK